MKIKQDKTQIITDEEFHTKAFDIGNKDKIFSIIWEKLYTDKIGSIIREILANAIDANKEVKSDKPVKIKLPTEDYPYVEIVDAGPGISPQRMNEIFTQLGNTTKDQDENSIGG